MSTWEKSGKYASGMTTQVGYVIEMTFLLFKLIEYIYKKIKYTNTVIFFFSLLRSGPLMVSPARDSVGHADG